MDKKVF